MTVIAGPPETAPERPAPGMRRVAFVGDSRALLEAEYASCLTSDLLPAYLTQHSDQRLRWLLPPDATTGPTVFVPPGVGESVWHDALVTLVEDPGVDALVVVIDTTCAGVEPILEALANGRDRDLGPWPQHTDTGSLEA